MMLPNRTSAYENAPLADLLSVLLRQFKRPLKTHGVSLTDADADSLAKRLAAGEALDSSGIAVRDALLDLVTESENALAGWNLTFEQALDTPMDAMPGWESTADFLEIANTKSNAELRISTGSILLLALGDDSRVDHVRFLALRPPDVADLDSLLARRVLRFRQIDA